VGPGAALATYVCTCTDCSPPEQELHRIDIRSGGLGRSFTIPSPAPRLQSFYVRVGFLCPSLADFEHRLLGVAHSSLSAFLRNANERKPLFGASPTVAAGVGLARRRT
jgi:hypothetical protein